MIRDIIRRLNSSTSNRLGLPDCEYIHVRAGVIESVRPVHFDYSSQSRGRGGFHVNSASLSMDPERGDMIEWKDERWEVDSVEWLLGVWVLEVRPLVPRGLIHELA